METRARWHSGLSQGILKLEWSYKIKTEVNSLEVVIFMLKLIND